MDNKLQFVCNDDRLGLRHWVILAFLKTEDGIHTGNVNIAHILTSKDLFLFKMIHPVNASCFCICATSAGKEKVELISDEVTMKHQFCPQVCQIDLPAMADTLGLNLKKKNATLFSNRKDLVGDCSS